MAAKKKRRTTKTLFVMRQVGQCADDPKLKLYSATVGGGYDVGPVTAANKTKGKRKLIALVKKGLR